MVYSNSVRGQLYTYYWAVERVVSVSALVGLRALLQCTHTHQHGTATELRPRTSVVVRWVPLASALVLEGGGAPLENSTLGMAKTPTRRLSAHLLDLKDAVPLPGSPLWVVVERD